MNRRATHSSHWGTYQAEATERGLTINAHPLDPDPSPLLGNVAGAARHAARIRRPAVRAGWLERGPGPDSRRGSDSFVAVDWSELIELLSGELRRVYQRHGPAAVYGGSYGWASAGRFHHAQSQVHRFLNCLGGYVRSVNTYSFGASSVILPHVVGPGLDTVHGLTDWSTIVRETELVVAFGGIPAKNLSVAPGGITRHQVAERLRAASRSGTEFVLISPIRDDLPADLPARWLPLRPATDAAVMCALAHTLVTEGLHDQAFIDRYCVGFEHFRRYLLGRADGQPKSPEWAEPICELPADELRALARRMADRRTLITVTWSLQRAQHGEQPPWLGIALAAMLGQLGLPGAGFGHGYGSMGDTGASRVRVPLPALPQGHNPVREFIPVARVADMLLHPGQRFDYDGGVHTYPEIRLVYWCGGNPFHHHQHLSRLRRALARPDTIVVHEPYWTPMARHADIVVPSTITLERDDLGASRRDPYLVAMQRALPPLAESRNDYDVFADLSAALGVGDRFTEGRSAKAWLVHLYETWGERVRREHGFDPPDFDTFWERGLVELPTSSDPEVFLADFRADPERHPLRTPSGRIELFSTTIAGFGYPDCPGHPAWLEPIEWLGGALAGRYPLHLIANQPRTRLHSQLDMGALSQDAKVAGREPIRINPADAARRGIGAGDVVRVYNQRGSCLAGAVLSEDVRPGVVQLATGAWYDPIDPADPEAMCVHGNPNVLTPDRGTSRLAQGCSGQHALVEVERYTGPPPAVKAFSPPPHRARATPAKGRP